MMQTSLCLQRNRDCIAPHALSFTRYPCLSLQDYGIRADKEKILDFVCGNSVLAQLTPQCILLLQYSGVLHYFLQINTMSVAHFYSHFSCFWILVSTCTFIFYSGVFFVFLYCCTLICILLLLPRPTIDTSCIMMCSKNYAKKEKKFLCSEENTVQFLH